MADVIPGVRIVDMIVDGEPAKVLRVDIPWGYVLFGAPGKNGMCVVNTMVGDPPELRFVSPDGGLGKFSFSMGDDPTTAVELAMVLGKLDERLRDIGRQDLCWGEITVHVRGPRLDPSNPRDDGMRPVALLLHDYVWFLGINGLFPQKPPIQITPGDIPPPPPPPLPPGPTPPPIPAGDEARRRQDVDDLLREFRFPLDPQDADIYIREGRPSLESLHADMVGRNNNIDPGPCAFKANTPETRRQDVDRLNQEFGFAVDHGDADRYISDGVPSLREMHDKMVRRNDGNDPGPCQFKAGTP